MIFLELKKIYTGMSEGATVIDENFQELIKAIYPVGSIYLAVTNTDPQKFLGGQWERFGKGRTIVSVDESDTDFSESNKIGGAKTHSLTADENGAHTHTQTLGGAITNAEVKSGKAVVGVANSQQTSSSGQGKPHNNMQPYITAYIWVRVE